MIFLKDSCIFTHKEGEYEPVLGDYLGEFTNEIDKKKGSYIREIVASAPKAIAYVYDTGVSHAICKGIAINNVAKLKINFESMKEIVLEDNDKKIEVEQLQFIRNKSDWTMRTEVGNKTYKYTFNKRIVLDNKYDTLPYGF